MSIPWRGLVRIAVIMGILCLVATTVTVRRASTKLAASPRLSTRFTEVRCDTLGIMHAANKKRVAKANADLASAAEGLKKSYQQLAECKAGLESALMTERFLGSAANVEMWRVAYEGWRGLAEISTSTYQMSLREVASANDEMINMPSWPSPGYRSPIKRGHWKWQRYLNDSEYSEYWNLDLTREARHQIPIIMAIAGMVGTFSVPLAGAMLLTGTRKTARWVSDGFSKKAEASVEEVDSVSDDERSQL